MKLTRRGLFGLFGGLVATTAIPRPTKISTEPGAVNMLKTDPSLFWWAHPPLAQPFIDEYNHLVALSVTRNSDLKILRALRKAGA